MASEGCLVNLIFRKIPVVPTPLKWLQISEMNPQQDPRRCKPIFDSYLSLGNGLGSGRMAAMERRACLEGDEEKFRSKEPAFLCSGSIPIAPCISLSMGQDPARPWTDSEDTSGPTAPWSEASTASWGSWVGEMDGGERDFFLVDAPARSFSSPLFFSFWRERQN